MKEKIAMMLLASCLTFGMVACGGSEEPKQENAKVEKYRNREGRTKRRKQKRLAKRRI